ncbi:MAG: TIGR00268 family protein [Caldilineaceae bacterium]
MVVAHQELGQNALACIGVSPSYPRREMRAATELAEQLQIPYRLVDTAEYLDEESRPIPPIAAIFANRNYTPIWRALPKAKGGMWSWMAPMPAIWATIAPALRRPASAMCVLRWWKPPSPSRKCARSRTRWGCPCGTNRPWPAFRRVPHGTPITPQLLRQIEEAEDVLAALGFSQFRVRHHGELARIELPPADLPRAVAHHAQIAAEIRQTGYRFVTSIWPDFAPAAMAQPKL